jgi:hypothetical protein
MRKTPALTIAKKTLSWYGLFGLVTVIERIWGTKQSSYHRPFAQRIGVTHHCLSGPLACAACDFSIDESFAKAAVKILEHYGFELNVSAVRKATLSAAQAAAKKHEKENSKDHRLLPSGSAPILAEADGSMVRTLKVGPRKGKRPRQWEEIRLAAAQKVGEDKARYAVSFESVADLGRRWGHCASGAGRQTDSPMHCLGDGAGWVEGQSREAFGHKRSYLVDFKHVSDYLIAAAVTCRPAGQRAWRRRQQRRLRRGESQLVIKELAQHLEAPGAPEEEAPVRAAHRYLSNRPGQFNYHEALAKGLPIGSGLIESGHKHVLQARLKLAGCAWLRKNADVMAQLARPARQR